LTGKAAHTLSIALVFNNIGNKHRYKGELWFFDNYIIPLAKKLKDCGVFGVSCDEFLDFATENRNEWAAKGEALVSETKASLLAATEQKQQQREAIVSETQESLLLELATDQQKQEEALVVSETQEPLLVATEQQQEQEEAPVVSVTQESLLVATKQQQEQEQVEEKAAAVSDESPASLLAQPFEI